MNKGISLKIKRNSYKRVYAKLNLFADYQMHRAYLVKALDEGSQPVIQAAKANLSGRERSGALKDSMNRRIKEYDDTESIISVIGSQAGHATIYNGKRHDPKKIAHLVEYGHGGPKPAPAKPFLRPAYASAKASAQGIIKKVMKDGVRRLGR